MGKIGSKPYVIDDFDSTDDTECNKTPAEVCRGYALAIQEKEVPVFTQPVIEEVVPIPKEPIPPARMRETKIGLKKLVKLLEKNDFEEAKKAANFLIENQVLSITNTATDNEEVFLIESAKSLSMSTGTSSWSSKSPAWITVTSDCTLSQITTESSHSAAWQQETVTHVLKDDNDEKKIVTNSLVQNSEIPQLLSSVWRYQKKSMADKDTNDMWATTPLMAPGGSKSSDSPKHTPSASSRSSGPEKQKKPTNRSRKAGMKTPTRGRASTSQGHSMKSHSYLTFSNNIDIHNRWAHRPIGTVKSPSKGRMGLKLLRTKFDAHKVQRKPKRRSSSSSKSVETQSAASVSYTLEEEKVLNFKRWYCVARPQYRTSSGVTSVVSCWNFLFSTLGYGNLQPVTQDAALMLLGFAPPFDEINFAVLADNSALLRWFYKLNSHFGVSGQCSYLYKLFGKNKTKDVTSEQALSELKEGLKDTKTAFIYHCYKHYFCPIGYEETLGSNIEYPKDSAKGDARDGVGDKPNGNAGEKSGVANGGGNKETWILIGDTCRNYPSIHCVSWTEVCVDLECKSPNFFDIRHSWKGIRQAGEHDSCHCILTFKKSAENATQLLNTASSITTHSSLPLSLPQQDRAPSPALPCGSQTIRGCASFDIFKPLGKNFKSFPKVKKEKVRSRSKSPLPRVPLAQSAHPSFMRVKSASPPKEKRKTRAKSVCKEYGRQHSPNTDIARNHFPEGDNYDFLIFDEQKNIGS